MRFSSRHWFTSDLFAEYPGAANPAFAEASANWGCRSVSRSSHWHDLTWKKIHSKRGNQIQVCGFSGGQPPTRQTRQHKEGEEDEEPQLYFVVPSNANLGYQHSNEFLLQTLVYQ